MSKTKDSKSITDKINKSPKWIFVGAFIAILAGVADISGLSLLDLFKTDKLESIFDTEWEVTDTFTKYQNHEGAKSPTILKTRYVLKLSKDNEKELTGEIIELKSGFKTCGNNKFITGTYEGDKFKYTVTNDQSCCPGNSNIYEGEMVDEVLVSRISPDGLPPKSCYNGVGTMKATPKEK